MVAVASEFYFRFFLLTDYVSSRITIAAWNVLAHCDFQNPLDYLVYSQVFFVYELWICFQVRCILISAVGLVFLAPFALGTSAAKMTDVIPAVVHMNEDNSQTTVVGLLLVLAFSSQGCAHSWHLLQQ